MCLWSIINRKFDYVYVLVLNIYFNCAPASSNSGYATASLNDWRSSIVVSNVNLSLASLALFSVVRSLLTCRRFNLSDFKHRDSILDFSIQQGHQSSNPKQKLLFGTLDLFGVTISDLLTAIWLEISNCRLITFESLTHKSCKKHHI